jgi:pyruvate/2-oxoglutarate dehydrogenase complex dihydrolipoamide acyltransferase (E2) component
MKRDKLSARPSPDAAPRAEVDAAGVTGLLVRFAVLGAIVLGALPATPEGRSVAQTRKSGADLSAARAKGNGGAGGKTAAGSPAAPAESKPAKISTAPFKIFIARAKKLADEGKLDLSKRQAITVEGDRREDGTLTNPVIAGESASNPHFRRTAEEFVAALNESRVLQPLEGVSRVSMTFTLDGEKFNARTASETPSEARADEMARGYRMMLNVAKFMRRGTGEAAVINGMKVSASGKQLLMNLDTTREAMGNLMLKQITPN